MDAVTPALIRETFPVGPLRCNCTIIGDPVTKKAIVVDPGGDHQLILDRLDQLGGGHRVSEVASRTGMLQRSFDILGAFRPTDVSVPPAQLARRKS